MMIWTWILEDDLRIDTYRSSGKGIQHVNKTDSAVRLTHLPKHWPFQCQNQKVATEEQANCDESFEVTNL